MKLRGEDREAVLADLEKEEELQRLGWFKTNSFLHKNHVFD